MTLRDALAAALHRVRGCCPDNPTYSCVHEHQADAILSDPTFRAALTEAIADELHESAHKNHNLGEGPARAICQSVRSHNRRAAAIVARMLWEES